ncbi:hypothetical protein HOLleu_41098 [Holothuria leucospilota]|uniref:Ig-like domain-containing protein n=1 Tax=Holothuria leucospilota TaxID=206669 RepID=A0A9Q0YDI3_HOLLE|nr:hypothetical protein HOLleu_41098 [Holothuria leucospilota]
MLSFHSVLCEAQVVFGPDDPDNNEVVYLGEDLTLRCEVLGVISDESVQFIILKDENPLIPGNRSTNLFEGSIGNIQVFHSSMTFVLQSLGSENAGTYECRAMSRMNLDYGGKTYTLELQQQDTVQCRRNVTDTYISMEVVRLSCYFTPSENKVVKWFKIDTSGMMELTSTTVEVNNVKHRVVSDIQPSDELNISNYVCEESQGSSTGTRIDITRSCEVGSFLVYNDAFIFVTPEFTSIPLGSSIDLTCNVVTLPSGIIIVVVWQLPLANMPVGVNTTTYESDTLRIEVSAEADVGSVLALVCNAFINTMQLSTDISITVKANDSTNATTQRPNNTNTVSTKNNSQNSITDNNNKNNISNFNEIAIIIIIVSLVAIVITASFILVVCLCLCRKNQDSEFVREDENMETQEIADESSPIPAYGKINKNKRDISGMENEIDASLEEDGDEDRDYNLVNLPINHSTGSTCVSANVVNQNRGVGENYTEVRMNSPDDGRPVSVLYTTVNKQLHHDQEYY